MTVLEILSKIPIWIKSGIAKNVKSSNMRTLLDGITRRMDSQETGRLKILKAPGNTSISLEIGDFVSGIIENTLVINAVYIGGNTSLLSSYALINDPNFLSNNPTENTYDNIAEMLADQENQTFGFNQLVLDASDDPDVESGQAIYLYLGANNVDLTDYIRLSDYIVKLPKETYVQTFTYPTEYPFITTFSISEVIDIQIEHAPNFNSYFEVEGNQVTSKDEPNDIMMSGNKVKIIYK